MSASLRSDYWACSRTAERRAAARAREARLENAPNTAVHNCDPPGYFFRPDRGRSLRLQDGIRRHPARPDSAQPQTQQQSRLEPEPEQQSKQRGVKHHHVLWSADEPWGTVAYQTASEAIHDVRATPGFRAGLGEKGYSRLQQKKSVPLIEMRKFLAGIGLHRYAEKLERRCGAVSPEHLLDIRRPQLESAAIGMPRPEILVFERAVKELARDYISRNGAATVARRVWGSATNNNDMDGAGARAGPQASATAAALTSATGAPESFAEVMGEFTDRHEFLSRMRELGQSGVHEAAMRREMAKRLHRLREIDQANSMATLWKEAKATHCAAAAQSQAPGTTGAVEALADAESMAIENYIKRYPRT